MKHVALCILIVAAVAVTLGQATIPGAADFKKLNWLGGVWVRTNSKPGRSGQEYWTKVSDTEWKGLGVNLNGNDTAFVEKLKLVIKDKNIFYVADVSENKEPTYFKITVISANGFTCENPEHDFPKKIAYQLDGKQLKATISGNGKLIDYYFEKK